MAEPAKETVIIVHGTWATPDPVKRRWYEQADGRAGAESFTVKLDAALQQRGSPARCWEHCSESEPIFRWSGDNAWIARTGAAAALADYVAKLQQKGWRCHIVAHSHGGNVVMESLPAIVAQTNETEPLGTIVTLGSPFMDTMAPILARAKRASRFLDVTSWIGFAVVTLLVAGFAFQLALPFVTIPALLLLLALPIRQWFARRRATQRGGLHGIEQTPLSFLAIGSLVDEAWQILHHMRTIENPLAIKEGLISYLFHSLGSNFSRSVQIARIHGAKSYRDLGIIAKVVMMMTHAVTFLAMLLILFMVIAVLVPSQTPTPTNLGLGITFIVLGICVVVLILVLFLTKLLGQTFYSAFLSPFRWCLQRAMSLGGIFTETATYVVRRRGWSVLQAIAMGLEGYRFATPRIEQFPSNVPGKFVKYENMPKGAEQRALGKRSAWVARHLGDVSETFANLTVTAADVTSLLRLVEQDQTLVHAAYYSDDECIARIAGWIAGEESSALSVSSNAVGDSVTASMRIPIPAVG